MGPQAGQLEFVPCGQTLQDGGGGATDPAQIRDHVFLIVKVKVTFPTILAQKGSLEVKG